MKHEMNLLPVYPGKKKRKDRPKRRGLLILIGSSLGVLTIYVMLTILDLFCQNDIKKIEEMIANKSDVQLIYTSLSQQKAVLEHRRLLLESINHGKELPLKAIAEIHNALPDEIRLLNYDFQDNRLIISGETQKKEKILEFKEKLTGQEIFKLISMVNTSKKEGTADENKKVNGEDVWEFTFDIQVAEV